jgi:hypothetical protein
MCNVILTCQQTVAKDLCSHDDQHMHKLCVKACAETTLHANKTVACQPRSTKASCTNHTAKQSKTTTTLHVASKQDMIVLSHCDCTPKPHHHRDPSKGKEEHTVANATHTQHSSIADLHPHHHQKQQQQRHAHLASNIWNRLCTAHHVHHCIAAALQMGMRNCSLN